MQKKNGSLLSQRGQMFLAGLGMWLLLALWSLSAFWQHIDALGTAYPAATRAGAAAGEFALLVLLFWHCFNKHINVRKWSLILGIGLTAAILVHAGALRGMTEAHTAQIDAEKRLEDTMTRMSREQMRGTKQKAKVAETAQRQVADTVRAGNDKVKDSSILPRWYLDGWMYSLLFVLSFAFVGAVSLMMLNREDVDENFDGIPDRLQQNVLARIVEPSEFPEVLPTGRLEPEGKGNRQ